MGEVIALLSGKGGTGKSTLCAGIAFSLAADGHQVLCIDCNAGLPGLDIFLGLSHTAPLNFQDILRGGATLKQLPAHPLAPTLRFLSAPTNRRAETIDQMAFSRLLSQAKKQFDFVILDGPAGMDAGFRMAALADRIAVVAGMDPVSIRAAARVGQELERMGRPQPRLIVNGIEPRTMAAMELTVDDLMDRAGLPLLGIVPADPQMALWAFGQPQLKQSKKGALAACRRMALRLQGTAQSIPPKLI